MNCRNSTDQLMKLFKILSEKIDGMWLQFSPPKSWDKFTIRNNSNAVLS